MSIETILRTCNKQAMDCLCNKKFSECYRLLKKAEEIIKSPNYPTNSKLSAVTWNNLGCYYKRINSTDLALEYLNKALREDLNADNDTIAGTHLNILAVHSQMLNHQQALHHGNQAIELLKSSNNTSTLITALQRTGDEYSYLGDSETAYLLYVKSLDLAKEFFGLNSENCRILQEKITSLSRQDKKFYFEKLRKRSIKQLFNNSRNSSELPKINEPIKPSKSLDRSRHIPKVKAGKKNASDRVNARISLNKQKLFINRGKSQANDNSYSLLEDKINFLQNQLENFEIRYKKLENIAKSKQNNRSRNLKKMGIEESAVLIQRWWRKYRERNDFKEYKKKMTRERAKRAIAELEILRKEAIKEDLYNIEPRPKTINTEIYRTSFPRSRADAARQRFSLNPFSN